MLKCIAIDDEPQALQQVAEYIEKIPYLELVGSFKSAVEAMKQLNEDDIDLMFLDINMPELNGIDFVKSLKVRPMVVFITAHKEYAVEAFRVEATDYLMKPCTFEAFEQAAARARTLYGMRWKHAQGTTATTPENEEYIFVKSEYKIMRVRVDDITYVESMSEYVRIHLESDPKPVLTLLTMRKMEETLPANRFMRVHRSYIVNMAKVTEVSRMRIVFSKNEYIPVGDLYKDKFMQFIDRYFIGKE